MPTNASLLLHSANERGNELLTYVCRYPKFIHGEAKTHRVIRISDEGNLVELGHEIGFMDDRCLSRSASSSRAVPISKYLEEVRSDELRATPSFSVIAGKGMQGGRSATEAEQAHLRSLWRDAALKAADTAEQMATHGGAKQDVNRILEPYIHINVIVSATEWQNFFGLRLRKDAQPEMRDLAVKMWGLKKKSKPKLLRPGEFHLPFVEEEDWAMVDRESRGMGYSGQPHEVNFLLKKVSAARCARVSYWSFETGRRSNLQEDLRRFDLLVGSTPIHASPVEHQATPDVWSGKWECPHEHGNFIGFRQFRKSLPREARAPIPDEFL